MKAWCGLGDDVGDISKIRPIQENVVRWIGGDGIVKYNNAGDPIIMSSDGMKKIRFDFANTHGDPLPHMHIEIFQGGLWIDASSTHRIYFNGN